MPEQPPHSPKVNQSKKDDEQQKMHEKAMHKVMNSCYKVTELISLSYERPITTVEKLQLYSHLAMCNACRAFAKNSKSLSQMVKAHKEFEEKQSTEK